MNAMQSFKWKLQNIPIEYSKNFSDENASIFENEDIDKNCYSYPMIYSNDNLRLFSAWNVKKRQKFTAMDSILVLFKISVSNDVPPNSRNS